MRTPASVGKHPIHPMLVAIPIGLFIVAFLCDIALITTENRVYGTVAYYSIAAGVVGALLAALPGFVDYTSLRGPRVKSIGTWHMILNLTVVVLFAINFYLRTEPGLDATGGSTMIPFALSLIGVVLLGISGWLGGEMVYVHGVGVDTEGRALIDEEARLRGDSPRRVA
ncbi:MAG TPA: DUF2231 domain-containing protein [Blastocatellia bacterium]|nr:DUF2231 domain-containing protein [Blastocatellia bacterium]